MRTKRLTKSKKNTMQIRNISNRGCYKVGISSASLVAQLSFLLNYQVIHIRVDFGLRVSFFADSSRRKTMHHYNSWPVSVVTLNDKNLSHFLCFMIFCLQYGCWGTWQEHHMWDHRTLCGLIALTNATHALDEVKKLMHVP
jgi:hypothetical protein